MNLDIHPEETIITIIAIVMAAIITSRCFVIPTAVITESKEKTKSIGKIYIADLIYKVNEDITEALNWISGIKQPSILGGKDELGYGGSIDLFVPLIMFNKLLNISGNGVSVPSAIPAVSNKDEKVLVEFERMLCVITQILTDGILQKPESIDIIKRVSPIVRFYYKDLY